MKENKMSKQTFLIIEGLTRAEALDLESHVGEDNVEIKQNEKGQNNYGVLDPITTVVLLSTISAVTAMISWYLSKRRTKSSTYLRVSIVGADNTLKELEFHKEEYEEMTDKDVAEAMGRQINDFMKNIPSIR
jgi:hypothetical protein